MNFGRSLRDGRENIRGESLSISPSDMARQSLHSHRRPVQPRTQLRQSISSSKRSKQLTPSPFQPSHNGFMMKSESESTLAAHDGGGPGSEAGMAGERDPMLILQDDEIDAESACRSEQLYSQQAV